MKRFIKILSCLFVLIISVSLFACNKKNDDNYKSNNETENEQQIDTTLDDNELPKVPWKGK